MSDALLFAGCFLACWLAAGAVAAAAFSRYKRRTAARDQLPAMPATSPAGLDALELLWAMPAYGTDTHTTNPTGDQTP